MVAPRGANGTHVNGIRIFWVDDDAMNVPGFFEPDFFPGFTRIQRLIETIASVETVSGITFACANPYNRGVVLLDGNRPDSLGGLFVENRLPGNSATGCLPNTSGGRARVNDVRIADHGIYGRNATAHGSRANAARLHAFEQLHIQFLCHRSN